MMISHLHVRSHSPSHNSTLLFQNPFLAGTFAGKESSFSLIRWEPKRIPGENSRRIKSVGIIKAIAAGSTEKAVSIKAIIKVKASVGGFLTNVGISRGIDDISDLLGKSLLLELVSSELDPKTGLEKETIKGYAHKGKSEGDQLRYESTLTIPVGFGEVGAVFVENEHHKEMFVEEIVLDGFNNGAVKVSCNSWVNSKFSDHHKRIFFTNKSYLPSETPEGLRKLREKELETLRGNGEGERKSSDRVYDYDTYNDLGNPDSSSDLRRPVLGGKENPYPRRCRTGRKPTKTDPLSETRTTGLGEAWYVPRDESFSQVKNVSFGAKTVYSVLHAVIPSLDTAVLKEDQNLAFPYFTAVDALFNEGINVPALKKHGSVLGSILPRLVKTISDIEDSILRFETPELLQRDKFAWIMDEEFGRQTLAGLNPYAIKLVTEWPLRSKLDPKIYGPPESAITTDMIEREIGGLTSVSEAIKQKKLFILDYHDAFLPYVNKVRDIKGTTLYSSRTLFFLTPNSTLRPLVIELTRPPSLDGSKPQWKQVFSPFGDSTSSWLWRIAKAHVISHDSGYHQLISHWLRTHCCTEPYIIATNRQLSAMHPIYRLLHPHFRYTMEINALAREALINAGGIIESSFSPAKYSMEISSAIYGQTWRFDHEALPADLISRGMALEDPNSPHGLKLTIEDYPFANDGLVLWDSIKEWVTDYVNRYYPEPTMVESDKELQDWWTEIRTKGHGDKKDEPWWPVLKTPENLIGILTIIIWVTSGHHAAVNFGQYHFAGYFPNRPTIARTKMPVEDPTEEEWKFFLAKPEVVLLMCFPSQVQATKVMAILDVLSNHSPDEEYMGEKPEAAWAEDEIVNAAFEKFNGRMKELQGIVDGRNADRRLLNRHGAGVVPYELLKPFSKPGVTGMGVPNSISI